MKTEKDIIDHINKKIKAGKLSESYITPFPKVFRYSNNYSINKDSIMDLKLSWALNYIARSSARANIGDGVLVVARSSMDDYIHLFSSVVVSDIGETNLWKNMGGHKWKYGYGIKKLSSIASIHQAVVESIIGLDFSWRYFTGLNFDNWGSTRKNGNAMKKLFNYCIKNYPVHNMNSISVNSVSDLNKILIAQ